MRTVANKKLILGSFYSKKLLLRLYKLGILTEEELYSSQIKRTYAGCWQRSSGAWIWQLYSTKNFMFINIGSIYPVKQLAKAKGIYASTIWQNDLDIDINTEPIDVWKK